MSTAKSPDIGYPVFRHNMQSGLAFLRTAKEVGETALVRSAQHEIAGMCGDYPEHMNTWRIEQAAIAAVTKQ